MNQLRQATRYQKHLLLIHRELRQQDLLTLKTTRECEDKPEVAEIIWKITRHELHTQDLAIIKSLKNPRGTGLPTKQDEYLKQWHRINPVFHPPTRSSITTIEVPQLDKEGKHTDDPDQAVTWQTIADPIMIEENSCPGILPTLVKPRVHSLQHNDCRTSSGMAG
jgi:hypothetical protein